LYQILLGSSSFFTLLLRLDEDTAAQAREVGCTCGGVLHSARYARKPRGGPEGLGPEHAMRLSFCCSVEGCRRRVTPPSLRFLGRKVFFGVLVVLVPILRQGPTPQRLSRLAQVYAVSPRTLLRWQRWWREAFLESRFWQATRGRFATPLAAAALPESLLAAFSGLAQPSERVLAVLRWLSPVTSGLGLSWDGL
jgi:hypothetical protein